MLLRLIRWSWRAWPILILTPLLCAHLLLLYYFAQSAGSINKTVSFLLQLVGGLLILYSIDSNIGVIKQKSLFALLKNYIKEFPFIKRSFVLEAQGAAFGTSFGKAKISVTRNPTGVDEKIAYLQEQIDGLRGELELESKELNEKIDIHAKKMGEQIQDAKSALQNLESKMDEVSTGGIKIQLFGVLLIVYGAIAGYVA
jgi:hypothetical protein